MAPDPKRRRSIVLPTARDISSTNRTLNTVLGGKQKSWMQTEQTTSDNIADDHPPARKSLPAINTVDVPPPCKAADATNTSGQQPIQTATSSKSTHAQQVFGTTPARPAPRPASSSMQTTMSRTLSPIATTTYVESPTLEQDDVGTFSIIGQGLLPSPAPSEDHAINSSLNAIVVEDDLIHQGSTAVNDSGRNANKQTGPLNKYGHDRGPTTSRTVTSLKTTHRASAKPCGPGTVVSLQPKRASNLFEPTACVSQLLHFEVCCKARPQGLSKLASARLKLLSDAVRSHDLFFMLLNQITALRTIVPQCLPVILSSLPSSSYEALDYLFCSNTRSDPTLLNFLSNFPASLPAVAASLGQASFNKECANIASFLNDLPQRWTSLMDFCSAQASLPAVHELVIFLEIRSSTLQLLAFRAIRRELWQGDINSPASLRAEEIFLNDRTSYNRGLRRDARDLTQLHCEYRVLLQLHKHAAEYQRQILTNAANLNRVALTSTTTDPLQPARVFPNGSNLYQYNPMVDSALFAAPHAAYQGRDPPVSRLVQDLVGAQTVQQLQNQQYAQWHNNGAPQTNNHHPQPLLPAHPLQTASINPGAFDARPSMSGARFGLPNGPQNLPRQYGSFAASQILPSQVTETSGRLIFPRAGESPRPQPTHPNPYQSGMHQGRLRSPIPISDTHEAISEPSTQLSRHVVGFAIRPTALEQTQVLQSLVFYVSASDYQNIPKELSSDLGEPARRPLVATSRTYRLRCSAIPSPPAVLDEKTWPVTDNVWPSMLYFKFNDVMLDVRRKLHHGKHLPVDLTPHMKQGSNIVEISINRSSRDVKPLNFAIAVEIVGCTPRQSIIDDCLAHSTISASEVLASIKQALRLTDGPEDDDVAVVDSNITINVFDPISACRMFDIPVRSSNCLHRDAFDLHTFLTTRKSQEPGWPTNVDEWKCPICGGDARPQTLVVDGFLAQVREELAQCGKLDTRQIVVEKDGTWKAKVEKRARSPDNVLGYDIDLGRNSGTAREVGPDPKRSIIILDDSDEG
ncbi:hypothetical protein LTR66_012127 [Elasticomyces elasticus]|nr:hypothetical protein LTR66_012127 [Elasticomyces elasticus]